jgi:speckle-type POZ protein
VAADRYDMERLASLCEFVLCLFIHTNVAVSTLVLAEQHGCGRLKEACFRFLECCGRRPERGE